MRRLARYLILLAATLVLALGLALVLPWPLAWLPVGLPPGGWSEGSLRLVPGPTLGWPSLIQPLSSDSLRLEHTRIRTRGFAALRDWWNGTLPLVSTLTIERVQWGRLELEDTEGRLFLTGDTLRIDSLRARVGDQWLEGFWRARRGGVSPVWTLHLQGEELLLDTLWARIYPERAWSVGGRIRLAGEVRRTAPDRVTHRLSLAGGPLTLRDWPLARQLQRELPLGSLDPLVADSLVLELGGRNGSEVKQASLWWPLGTIGIRGLVADPDRPGQGLDLQLEITLNERGRERLSLPGALDELVEWVEDPDGALRFRARVTGSLEQPQVHLDTKNQRRRARQKLEGLLRNLLGP